MSREIFWGDCTKTKIGESQTARYSIVNSFINQYEVVKKLKFRVFGKPVGKSEIQGLILAGNQACRVDRLLTAES